MRINGRRPGVAWVAGLAVVAALVAGGAGCDRRVREADAAPGAPAQPEPRAATRPATLPADAALASADDPDLDAAPETQPVEPPPVLTSLAVDGLTAHFPPTKLLLHEEGGGLRVELFSDLPKSAIKDYNGNELYLEMDLQGGGGGPQKLEDASWRYKSISSERAESANGIFLDGQRRHLQPDDVMVRFVKRGDQLVAQVLGQFRGYEPGTPDALAPFVGVRGELTVEIVEKR